MKIKATIIALSVILPTITFASVSQSENVVLKPVNDNIETQACYVAATEGVNQAKSFLRANAFSFANFNSAVKCNGIGIADFAEKYSVKNDDTETAVQEELGTFKLVAMDNSASQLCVDAVLLGERKARIKHNALNDVVFCNDKSLGRFTRVFKDKNLSL